MARIKKEKTKKGPDGTTGASAIGDFWNGMSEKERVAWYLKQKRGNDMKYKNRDLGWVSAEINQQHFQKRGRQAYNNLVSCATFFKVMTAMGEIEPSKIAEAWRELLKNPAVGREECVDNDGKAEICL